jgi:hypothetical protein
MSNLDMALRYAEAGYRVLPLFEAVDGVCTCRAGEACTRPGKHPACGGVHDATTDQNTVKGWWERYPQHNVAVAVPVQYVVFDIDPRHGGTLQKLDRIPETVVQHSGSGGWHVWFRLPYGVEVDSGVPWLKRDGIDLRVAGKHYVAVEPSLHVSGARYLWEPGCSILERTPANIPTPLLDAIRKVERESVTYACYEDDDTAGSPYKWFYAALEKVADGNGRRLACWWMACQMRDDLIPHERAEAAAVAFAERVTDLRDHPYTEAEALRCVAGAYSYPPRGKARAA